MINFLVVDKIIKDALVEDIPHEDISTNSVINKDCISTIDLICKEEGIIAGLEVFKRVFDIIGNVEVTFLKATINRLSSFWNFLGQPVTIKSLLFSTSKVL